MQYHQGMESQPLLDIPIEHIDGTPGSLAEHKGKVILIVNVASKCGFTPQYEGLQALYDAYRERGFAVCGFPANDFAAQEPGSNQEIQAFCQSSFGVTFPMYAKIAVTGAERHPLYGALIAAQPEVQDNVEELRKHLVEFGVTPTQPPEVLWNFEKFLLSREGDVVARFSSSTAPDDTALRTAIERQLV